MLHCYSTAAMFCCTRTTTTLLIQNGCFKLFHVTKSFSDSELLYLAVAPDLPISCFPSSRGIFRLPIKWQMEIVCQMWSQEGNIKKQSSTASWIQYRMIRLTSGLVSSRWSSYIIDNFQSLRLARLCSTTSPASFCLNSDLLGLVEGHTQV